MINYTKPENKDSKELPEILENLKKDVDELYRSEKHTRVVPNEEGMYNHNSLDNFKIIS